MPFTPKGLSGVGVSRWPRSRVGHFRHGHQKIVGQRCRQWLTLFIVAHPLIERVSYAVRNSADYLSFGNYRIDNLTRVVHENDARHLHGRRIDVDFDFRNGRAVAVRHLHL